MVYVAGESRYGFTPLEWVYCYLIDNLDQVGVVELGSKGFVVLRDLAQALGSKSEFVGERDDQIFMGAFKNQPKANDVIDFCKMILKEQN